MSEHRFYVYICYYDAESTQPFYVGKGSGRRYLDHGVPVRIVWQHLTASTALSIESALIRQIGRIPNGPLVNANDGGGGPGGFYGPHTLEARAKISAANHNRSLESRAKTSVASRKYHARLKTMGIAIPGGMTGKKHRLETRLMMSAIAKENGQKPPKSDEIIQKMSIAQIKRWAAIPVDQRPRSFLGRNHSLETRSKMSAIAKSQGRRPPLTDEVRRKLSEASKRQWERRRGRVD